MPKPRFSRQVLAFGETGQQKIAAAHAAIVGVGGLGSHAVQQLGYLGVGNFILIDPDRVEESNLNRLVGATPDDVGQAKAQVLGAALERINSAATASIVASDLRSRAALSALRDASVVFGCVDNEGARLILMEFCCAYEKPYIDSATEILPATDNQPFEFGGRVVVSIPGEFCLSCANELDTEEAKEDLEPADVRAQRQAHGYGAGEAVPAPAVVSLNGVIASIAVTEFVAMTTGLRAPHRKSVYKGMRGVVHVSTDKQRADCINCGYLLGKGDRADVMRYALDRV